jgi:hypothetical protein
MKLLQLISVLALAGAVSIGCNSGPPITGEPVVIPPPGSGGSGGGNGGGGAGGGGEGACINEDDGAVYAELEFTNGNGEMTTGTDAASAIGSECVRGSTESTPPVTGCGTETLNVVACFPSCPPATVDALATCVEGCIQDTISTITGSTLTEDCITCYGATVACGAAFCTDLCVVDTTSPECIGCRCTMGGTNGCTPDFVDCSGIPSDDC